RAGVRAMKPSRVFTVLAALATISCVGKTTDTSAPLDIQSPGSWTARAPMPTARQEVAAAALDGRIFVIGGLGAGAEPVTTVEVYDPGTDRWEARASLPAPAHHLAAAALGGREAFLGTQYAAVEVYDPATNGWFAGTPLPTARGGLAAAVLGDRVFAFGGEAPLRIFSATEMYEVAGTRWIGKEPMRTP